jgi:hypothetical protein
MKTKFPRNFLFLYPEWRGRVGHKCYRRSGGMWCENDKLELPTLTVDYLTAFFIRRGEEEWGIHATGGVGECCSNINQ